MKEPGIVDDVIGSRLQIEFEHGTAYEIHSGFGFDSTFFGPRKRLLRKVYGVDNATPA